MSRYREYDYLVINDRIPEALTDLRAIVKTTRLRISNAYTDRLREEFALEVDGA